MSLNRALHLQVGNFLDELGHNCHSYHTQLCLIKIKILE